MKMQVANRSVEIASRDTEIKRLNGLIQQLVGGNQPIYYRRRIMVSKQGEGVSFLKALDEVQTQQIMFQDLK